MAEPNFCWSLTLMLLLEMTMCQYSACQHHLNCTKLLELRQNNSTEPNVWSVPNSNALVRNYNRPILCLSMSFKPCQTVEVRCDNLTEPKVWLVPNSNALVRNYNGSILCHPRNSIEIFVCELVKVCLSIFATLWANLPFLFQG